jgi:hypothetical protein
MLSRILCTNVRDVIPYNCDQWTQGGKGRKGIGHQQVYTKEVKDTLSLN